MSKQIEAKIRGIEWSIRMNSIEMNPNLKMKKKKIEKKLVWIQDNCVAEQ